MSEIPGTVGWERRRAEKAEAERDALAAKCAKLEAALTEANDTPAWEALKLCRTERDALAAKCAKMEDDLKKTIGLRGGSDDYSLGWNDAANLANETARAALQSTEEKP